MDTDEKPILVTTAVDAVTREIIGAAFEVSNTLGHGFLEKVYHRALIEELSQRGVMAAAEVPFQVSYKGRSIGVYEADLVVAGKVLVELKAVEALTAAHRTQTLNYLKASGLTVGLLINVGTPRLEYKRVLR